MVGKPLKARWAGNSQGSDAQHSSGTHRFQMQRYRWNLDAQGSPATGRVWVYRIAQEQAGLKCLLGSKCISQTTFLVCVCFCLFIICSCLILVCHTYWCQGLSPGSLLSDHTWWISGCKKWNLRQPCVLWMLSLLCCGSWHHEISCAHTFTRMFLL